MKFIKSRITGGSLRGREILSPESDKTHPMGSRERLAFLNSLGPDIKGSRVLDLFAGTGALGIEALSRGAEKAVFVENDQKVVKTLKENLKNLEVLDKSEVLFEDVKNFEGEDFDYVFLDPPYDKIAEFDIEKIMQKFSNVRKIVLSHPKGSDYSLDGFGKRVKTYASASITIFTKI